MSRFNGKIDAVFADMDVPQHRGVQGHEESPSAIEMT